MGADQDMTENMTENMMETGKSRPDPAHVPGTAGRAYTLVRARRKTLAIHITKDAVVEVRAPLKMSISYIDHFVASKESWIRQRLAERIRVRDEKAAFSLGYGDPVWLFGRQYPLTAADGRRPGFDGSTFRIPAGLQAEKVKDAVIQVYRQTARRVCADRIAAFTERMRVEPAGFHITGAMTRWGSCSAKHSLNFSWRLMMADEEVIDYVIVHELAHIRELNNSPRFWAHVEAVLPDYKARQQRLRQLQSRLSVQDWG